MYYIEVVPFIVVRDLGKKVFFLSLIRKRWASWGEGESKGLCARGLSMSRMTTMIAICFFLFFVFDLQETTIWSLTLKPLVCGTGK